MASCTEQGQVTCWDGTCSNTYAGCPAVDEGTEAAYISGGEHGPYDNPWADGSGDNEAVLQFVFDNMGGLDYFDMDFAEFSDSYGDNFMEYNPEQAENVYDQLGLLDWAEDVRDTKFELDRDNFDVKDKGLMHTLESSREATEGDLFSAALQLEGVTRAGRGIRSGQVKKRSNQYFSSIRGKHENQEDATLLEKEGIKLDRSALDNAYDSSLIDFESRELNLINDIYKIEQNFEDSLWDQINARLADSTMEGVEGDTIEDECVSNNECGEGQSCVDGICENYIDTSESGTGDDDLEFEADPHGEGSVQSNACQAVGGTMQPNSNGPVWCDATGDAWNQYNQILDDYSVCPANWNWDTQSCSDATPPAGDTGYCPCGYDDNNECNPYTGTPVGSGYSWDISDVTCL